MNWENSEKFELEKVYKSEMSLKVIPSCSQVLHEAVAEFGMC
jgi:hypothetical protein